MTTAPTFTRAYFIALLALIAGSASADRAVKPDRGKFTMTLQEAPAGSETFSITADGSSKYNETILLSCLVAAFDVKRGGAQQITLLLTEAITPPARAW